MTRRIRFQIEQRDEEGRVVATYGASSRLRAVIYLSRGFLNVAGAALAAVVTGLLIASPIIFELGGVG